jgi:hypothetical protein
VGADDALVLNAPNGAGVCVPYLNILDTGTSTYASLTVVSGVLYFNGNAVAMV